MDVQGIHLWRSGLVRDIKGEWFWDTKNERWAYRIVFELYDNDPMDADERIKEAICLDFIKEKLPGKTFSEQWSHHVWEEVIESEIKGQRDKNNHAFFEQYFNGINICYCYELANGKIIEIGS